MEDAKNQPVLHFADDGTLQAYLKYWQHVLHLDDWIIKAVLTDKKLTDDEGNELCGINEYNAENKESHISISKKEHENSYIKHCEEQVLVHELIHCIIVIVANAEPNVEQTYFELIQHQLVEGMAKSLIMAKYGVDMDWFLR